MGPTIKTGENIRLARRERKNKVTVMLAQKSLGKRRHQSSDVLWNIKVVGNGSAE